MSKYVFVYRGGSGMAATPAEQQQVMAAWGAWYARLGAAIVDGGAPFGASTSVSSSGIGPASSALGGYTVVTAPSIEAASALTDGCPVMADGGSVDIYDCVEMGA